jgi:cytosine/adenosine deaminase-related metal-dependent hydrolase
MLVLRAKYVFPIDGPPLRDGIVAIAGDRIVAIGDDKTAAIRDLLGNTIDLGNFAILPGFVNAHTHLELSDSPRLAQPGISFPEWIREIVEFQRLRRQQRSPDGTKFPNPEPLAAALANGSEQLKWAATTTVGDIESGINSPLRDVRTEFLKNRTLPFDLISFLEVIALKETNVADASGFLGAALELRRASPDIARLAGISPHAPYTVHPKLLERCVRLSAERCIPVAHHLAESREELMLLRTGHGPFVKLLEDFNAWDPTAIPFGSRPLDYLQQLAKSHRALVIHGNYLDDAEIEFVGAHAANMSIVYCPRTHAYFQHDAYPLAKMLAAGVNVAIGTDSRASNPDLSVLTDMRFAATQHPLISPQLLLRMITANAARALGRDTEVGSLAPGKFADLAILALPNHCTADPHEMLFDSDCRIVGSMFRGQLMLRTDDCPPLTAGNS